VGGVLESRSVVKASGDGISMSASSAAAKRPVRGGQLSRHNINSSQKKTSMATPPCLTMAEAFNLVTACLVKVLPPRQPHPFPNGAHRRGLEGAAIFVTVFSLLHLCVPTLSKWNTIIQKTNSYFHCSRRT